jgi:uncharacterized protein
MEAGGNVQEAKKGGSGNDQDLSMEEILQSIRRIIAEDDGDKKPADASTATDDKKSTDDSAKGENGVPGSDVLELTEMLKDDGSVVNVKDEPKEEAPVEKADAKPEAETPKVEKEASNDVLAKINEALHDAEKPEPAAEPVKAEAPKENIPPAEAPKAEVVAAPATPSSKSADALLSAEAAAAASSQFKRLGVDLEQDVHVPSPPFRSGSTVEELVIEMLRPMMKDWLDTNLPQIVERIVEREVKKLK